MALTVPQAALAGQISANITALQAALATAQDALSGGMFVTSHGLHLQNASGKRKATLGSDYQLGSTDSTAILNILIAAYQSSIASLTTQLAGM